MREDGRTKAQLITELASLRLQYEKIKEQEGKLRSSEERYRNFVENAVDGCAEYDAGGRCTFCNEAACTLVGLTREEYIERSFHDHFAAKEEAASAMKAVREIQQTGKTANFIFTHPVRKDGTTKVIEASVSSIRDGQGKTTGFRSITRDLTDRKKIEEERERYRTFVDNIDDGCYEFDLEGNILFCNEGLPRIFGYSREEFLRLDRWKRHIDREYGKQVFRLYDQMYKNNVSSSILEYKILRRDAQIRDYETSVSIIRNQAGQVIGYRGIGRDITERKKMEDEQRRYREFFENVDDVCAEYDLKGKCTFCNQAAVRIFGYSKEELMRLRHHERFPSKQEAEKVYNAFHEIYVMALPVNIVVAEFLCKDGKIKSLEAVMSLIRDADGHPAGFRSIGRDVTERRTMEQELARYRDFMESIEDSCAEFDLGGRCTFCNEAAHRMLGYSRKEYLQLHYRRRFVGPEDIRQVFSIFTELYRTGDPAKIYTVNVWCKDGSTKAIESIVTLIRDARGGVVGFRNIGRDVTARKRMEEEQERLRQQLSQARKMEAIGTLAGGVAHDFNNLLMGIQGYTSLMLLDTDPGHPHYAQLKSVESHVRSGADLTRQLLGYARGGRYEVKPVNLNEIVGKSAVMFGRTKKEITIVQDLTEDAWIVDADRGQMEQVLLNLLVNAWHAMPGGGEIFIRTRNVVLERSHVRSLDIPPGPYVKLTVKDTGVGMDEMTRERLFEPFFTTKEMGVVRGTGLGLASVYGIVKGHQGAINVQSERGKGATFDIYFPASFKEVIREPQPERIARRGRETILLADDEANIAEVIGAMIKELGYQLLTAGSGEEAVDIYLADSGRIDLVIMDMIMPGLGGGAAIDAIRAENPEARIILSSGYSLDGEAQEILSRRGKISFMQKPFELTDLSQKIREALDF